MKLIRAEDVAKLLGCSKWFIYKNPDLFGGFRIKKLLFFEQSIVEQKLKEVMENGGVQTPGQMAVRLSEAREADEERRLQNESRSNGRAGKSQNKSQKDEFGLRRIVRDKA
jgi:hypothetical protein